MADYSEDGYDLTIYNPIDFVSDLEGNVIIVNVGESDDYDVNSTTFPSLKSTDFPANDATTGLIDQPVEQNISWGKVAPSFILCFAGIVGCLIAMVHVLRLKKSFTTTSHWFLFHVFASNCILSLSLVLFLSEEVVMDNIYVTSNLCIARNAVLFMSFFSSAIFLTFISIDRFLAHAQISSPRIKFLQSQIFIYTCTGLAWVVSIILSIPIAQYEVSTTWATIFLSYFSTIYFIAVLLSCSFCGIALRASLKKNPSAVQNSDLHTVSEDVQESNSIKWVEESKEKTDERSLTLTSALMIAYFFVSWILLFSVYLRNSQASRESLFMNCIKSDEISTTHFIGELLVYVNAVVNPYIHIVNTMSAKPRVTESDSVA